MTSINYLKGDATQPQAKGNKLIVHVCNDLGGWGKGFVLAISKRWPEPEKQYRVWHRNRSSNDFELGAIQIIQVEKYVWVANLIGQRGMKSRSKGHPVRYDAIQTGLSKVAEQAKQLNASVHMPRIGCGLAGGKWQQIEPLIKATLLKENVIVFVYDYD